MKITISSFFNLYFILFLFLVSMNFVLVIDAFADNDLSSDKVEGILVRAINWLAGIIATFSVLIVIVGGFVWMTAGGEENKVESAKKWIISGLVGLALGLSAFMLINIIIGFFE